MNTILYLEHQFANLHAFLHHVVGDLTEDEWVARAAPGQNRIGFIVWHMPRSQDNMVNTWIRGVPEVLQRIEWARERGLQHFGMGTGIPFAEADSVATLVSLSETLEYAEAVHQDVVAWLREQSEDDLDLVPDAETHLAPYPEYQTKEFREQLSMLYNQPVWNLLMRPCIGHAHRHLGELQLAKVLLRLKTPAS